MKARSSKSQKIGIVKKGLVHGSGQKLVIYREFLLGGEIGAEKCVYDILQGRNAFLNYENTKFKKSINLDFYKGVHGFGQKLLLFPDFYLAKIDQKKCVLGNSRKEETPF